jgi:hypothetical protein
MTDEQKMAIRCAFADLCGAMQAHLQGDNHTHDWKAHLLTIYEMAQAFDFLDPIPADLANEGETNAV